MEHILRSQQNSLPQVQSFLHMLPTDFALITMNMERSNQVPKTGLSVCAEALPEALPICCVVLLTAAKPLCNFQLSLAQAAEVMFAGTILDTHATRTVASKMNLRWNGLVMDVAAIDIDPIHLTHLAQTADGQLPELEMMVVLEPEEDATQEMAVFQLPEIQQLQFDCVKKQLQPKEQ